MYYPSMDHVHRFRDAHMDKAKSIYMIVRQNDNLEKHGAEILTDKARLDSMKKRTVQSNGRYRTSAGNNSLFVTDVEDDCTDSHLEDFLSEQPTRKRSRTTNGLGHVDP
jgi:hypothetical protein